MKVFASAIALLFTSAAAASEIHEILTLSSVAEAVSVYHEAQDDGDVNVPCAAETTELFECLGDKFTGCFMELIKDLEEDTTCDDLKNSDFCPELFECAAHVDGDCDAKGEALESCAATAYPDQEDCDLCTVEEEVIAVEVTASPTDAMSLPHVVKAVSVYHEAKDDDDVEIPCVDETIEFFTCLGEEFTMCFFDIIEDLEEDTTCDDLKNSDFCPEIAKCQKHLAYEVEDICRAKMDALESCAATAYPDHEQDGCDICDTEEYVFGTFEVTASPTDAMSLPHVVKAVSVYHEAKDDADVEIPCVDETIEFFTCLGVRFTMCFFDIMKDLEEDTTCDDLKNSDFCPEIAKCQKHLAYEFEWSCGAQIYALESCAATAYPDHEQDGCDICDTDVAILSIA